MDKRHISKEMVLKHIKEKKSLWKMGYVAGVSLFWLIIRTGGKPSRITYPCQKAAVANINIFLLALFAPLLPLGRFKRLKKITHTLDSSRLFTAVLLIAPLLLAFGSFAFIPSTPNMSLIPVSINLPTLKATSLTTATSDLYFVESASGAQGNLNGAVSSLVTLMSSHGLNFYKTASQPSGLIGKNDVVIIKVNCQWDQDGGTNTDLVKAIIQEIVNHPEGFTGEVVIADNGQWMARTSQDAWFTTTNSYTHSQSEIDVANSFHPTYKVSTWLWEIVRSSNVAEYSSGDTTDGYVVSTTADPDTGMHLSYPKFKTTYGTYISLKHGIWSGSSYDNTRLKLLNVPVLKSHGGFGVTGCVKHYMGVLSGTLTEGHGGIQSGGLATVMALAKFPTLNILDCIYVNANPAESLSANVGPGTPYSAASYANKIGASLDPVALDYYSAKYILMPAAQQLGYSSYVTLNPDSTYVVPSIQYYCPFHTYLVNSMNELNRHGFQVTMNASQMNVYVSSIAARAHGDCQAPWGSIDMKDIGYVARRFDCRPGKSLWDPIADFNGDDWINMKDVALPSRNFQVSY